MHIIEISSHSKKYLPEFTAYQSIVFALLSHQFPLSETNQMMQHLNAKVGTIDQPSILELTEHDWVVLGIHPHIVDHIKKVSDIIYLTQYDISRWCYEMNCPVKVNGFANILSGAYIHPCWLMLPDMWSKISVLFPGKRGWEIRPCVGGAALNDICKMLLMIKPESMDKLIKLTGPESKDFDLIKNDFY